MALLKPTSADAAVACSVDSNPVQSATFIFDETTASCSGTSGAVLHVGGDEADFSNGGQRMAPYQMLGQGCTAGDDGSLIFDTGAMCLVDFLYTSNDGYSPLQVEVTFVKQSTAVQIVSMVASGGNFDVTLPPADTSSDPTITSISPSQGPATGGTVVTITGTNFASDATVMINDQPATNVTVVDTQTITATTPSGTPTAANVIVTSNGVPVVLPGGFYYRTAPTVSLTTPPPVNAAAAVTLTASVSDDLDNPGQLTYAWLQTAGTTVVFTGQGSSSIRFTAPVSSTASKISFQLTVTNTGGVSASAAVDVDVLAGASLASDATLSALSLSGLNLTPGFDPATTSYTAQVTTDVSALTVTPTVNESHAAVTVDNLAVTSGAASRGINLDAGPNTIAVVVIAQDGTTSKTYTIVVTRAAPLSSDATLASLGLSSGTLSPGFSSSTLSYTAAVANAVTAVTVTPTSNDRNASVHVTPTAVNLNVGENAVQVQVTAEDGATTKIYTVTITRAQPDNQAPVANASGDRTVASGASVTLDGRASSDPDVGETSTLSYAWTLASADAQYLNLGGISTSASTLSFTAPHVLPGGQAVVLHFTLTVTDIHQASSSANVAVTVSPSTDLVPVANAGTNQTVNAGTANVALTGSVTDSDSQIFVYAWTQSNSDATQLTLKNAGTANASFDAPALQAGAADLVLHFSLTVNDGEVNSAPATVTITVKAPKPSSGVVMVSISKSAPSPGDIVTITGLFEPTTQSGALETVSPFMFAVAAPFADLIQLADNQAATIAFYDNGVVIPGCGAVPVDANGKATCNVTVTSGQHVYSATYSNGEVNISSTSSNSLTLTATNTPGPEATATGSFMADRNNQIVSNLFDMGRDMDRLNDAQGSDDGNSGFADYASKTDLPPAHMNAAQDAGTLIPATGSPSTSSGMADIYGLQAMLYNAMQNAGDTGTMDRFSYSGAFDAKVNAHEGLAASFHTSLSQIMKFSDRVQAQQAANMGFGASHMGMSHSFSPLDIWLDGSYGSYAGTRSGKFGLFGLGADYVFNSSLLVGVFSQIDATNQTSGTALNGYGWLAGPYATARLGDQLFVNARAGFGTSSNTMAGTGSFTSRRWLASASLSGKWRIIDEFALTPDLSFTYFSDYSSAYTDNLGIFVPGVKTELGQIRLSPTITYDLMTDGDFLIEPSLTPELIWNFASANVDGLGPLTGTAIGPTGLRGRIKAGLGIHTASGIAFSATGSYDGIGSGGYSAMSALATVNVPLD